MKTALEWFQIEHPTLGEEIAAARTEVVAPPPLTLPLAALLDARPGCVALRDAARSLGVSERTLQRRLQEHGTNFQEQLNASQVRAAQKLLSTTNATVAEVAIAVGCSSPQYFNVLFRRLTGESPGSWRASRRWRAK
jgi:AraC-like DNA-binding protein